MFLEHFPQTEDSPRHIITYMLDKYIDMYMINEKPHLLIEVTFKFLLQERTFPKSFRHIWNYQVSNQFFSIAKIIEKKI